MHIIVNNNFGAKQMPVHGPHCTRNQAKTLLESLRAAYQSLLPAERIVIRGIVAQSARTQLTLEIDEEVEEVVR